MGKKENCWEFLQCGREPGGKRTDQLGVCPAAIEEKLDGINDGKAGGRACWTVEDTLCSGTISNKSIKCILCDFYKKVCEEEGHPSTTAQVGDAKKDEK